GEDVWQPGSGWQQVLSGNDYAIWTQAQPQVRTVVYIYKKTSPGQRLFMRGGHEPRLVKFEHFPYTEEPIIYNNTLNPTTTLIKTTDSALDWLNNSALDWTTHQWNEDWGPAKFYPKHGYGQDPENTWGAYWWKFDVMMPGAVGDWFEFKALMKEGHHEIWEDKIVQEDTPYVSKHHWGKKGMITRVRFNDNWVDFMPLNTATLKANFIIMPQDIYVGDTLSLDASTSSYETNETAEFRWDWQNDGHYDTEWSTEATIQYTVTKAGEHTIKLEIRDQQDQRATQTSTINVKSKDHLIVHYQNLNNWVTPMMHWGFNYFAEGVTDTPLTGHDNYGPYFQVNWDSKAESLYLSFYDGHLTWDGIDRQLKKPAAFPAEIWIQNQDAQVYTQNPAPTVQLTTPKHGAILKGQVSLTATAHDNQGIVKVEFFYDAVRIATATSEPYTVQWDTTTIPDGIHTLTSKAYDAAGNVTTSAAKMVTTHNATLSPAAEESSKILFPRS
ncbi:MAG: Ig-like domain-containing protein, partial [Pseudomonadota bacterium]|nr:Ig-like domain-containing protein [Pseudomonadota bacterium]